MHRVHEVYGKLRSMCFPQISGLDMERTLSCDDRTSSRSHSRTTHGNRTTTATTSAACPAHPPRISTSIEIFQTLHTISPSNQYLSRRKSSTMSSQNQDRKAPASSSSSASNLNPNSMPKASYIHNGRAVSSPPLTARISSFAESAYVFLGLYLTTLFSVRTTPAQILERREDRGRDIAKKDMGNRKDGKDIEEREDARMNE